MPKVSVIVPSYNHEPFLEQRLDSVFGQTFDTIEVHLLDDASTDGSAGILQRYADHPKTRNLIVSSENSGSTFQQWKRGIALCTGEYLWIAESDDYADLNFLQRMVGFMEQHPEASLAFCNSNMVDETGAVRYTTEKRTQVMRSGGNEDTLISGDRFALLNIRNVPITNASAVLMRRAALQEVPDEIFTLQRAGDLYAWAFLASRGTVGQVPEFLNHFRQHRDVAAEKRDRHRARKLVLEWAGLVEFSQWLFPKTFPTDVCRLCLKEMLVDWQKQVGWRSKSPIKDGKVLLSLLRQYVLAASGPLPSSGELR